ncbi:MAG: deoxyribodipyrimidine photo-lyase, partial [bacterium]
MPKPALLWFRQDLRLADNPALHAVADRPIL